MKELLKKLMYAKKDIKAEIAKEREEALKAIQNANIKENEQLMVKMKNMM